MSLSLGQCISIHAPLVGSDLDKYSRHFAMPISIHAPLVGSDQPMWNTGIPMTYFNPRSPCGERQGFASWGWTGCKDFNPRSPCGERRPVGDPYNTSARISIHAPLVGSDLRGTPITYLPKISIHAPLVGSDRWKHHYNTTGIDDFNPRSPCGERLLTQEKLLLFKAFQSTLPLWGATLSNGYFQTLHLDFNPRSPCGERLLRYQCIFQFFGFQSTLPLWGATCGCFCSSSA